MNWNISASCIRNPIPAIVLFLLLTIAGITALASLGIETDPNIDLPEVTVDVSTPTETSVTELETQITRKIENSVAGVVGVKHVNSRVTNGYSSTRINFELGTNGDRATSDVREAINRIRSELPKDINEPAIHRTNYTGDETITYTVTSNKRSPEELSSLLSTTVARSLESLPAIGKVDCFGARDRQIDVQLDPVKLEAYGVTADMVNTQLSALNTNVPGGSGRIGGRTETIRTLGSVKTVDELRKTRISLSENNWVELASLGTVSDGLSAPQQYFLVDGKPAIGLDVYRRYGKNLVDMEKDTFDGIAKVEKQFPDLKFKILRNPAKFVKESCSATFEAMLLGALLAIVVIFLFLRNWRAALISAIAMPLSVIPTFAFLQCANYTLNNMTLLGMALVIGILVDDAIVEIENIVRHMNMGKKPYKASIDAADEIGLAVVATTMAAVVVFLPVAFMGGISGLYFRQFGWTVAVAIFCSLLVARLITPVMAAYFLKPHTEVHTESKLGKLYSTILSVALRHRFCTVLLSSILFGGSVALFQSLPTSLISRVDSGSVAVRVELPAGAQLSATRDVVEQITKIANGRPEVESVFGVCGFGMGQTNKGFINITLKPRDQRKLSQDEFEIALRPELSKVPGARINYGGGWGSGRVQIMLTSVDSGTLQKSAQELLTQIRMIPELSDVQSNVQSASPEIVIIPDGAKAAEQGVSVETIARTAAIATLGSNSASSPKFDLIDRQIPIAVRLAPEATEDLSVISHLKIANKFGKLVPLNNVATVKIDRGVNAIERFDRSRQIQISAKFGSNYSLSQALKRIHDLPAFKQLPPSISDHPSGDVEDQKELFGGFGYAIFAGVALIYSVLCLLFRGFLQPLTIMMSLPLSLAGALVGLWLLSKPIDTYALIGIVMLMGLVTKNAILLVEYCLTQMQNGVPRTQAIFAAGRTRMRPILMTTIAMIAGMIPIAAGLGAGAEARAPMAVSVIGGLFMSTLLTLIVVPVVFTYMDDVQSWFKSLMETDTDEEGAHEADTDEAGAEPQTVPVGSGAP